MSRAYVVYILMFAVLAAGLWVTITLGAAGRAPDDLSGDWSVAWIGPQPPGSDLPTLHIEQSGRFFEVRLGNRPPVGMKLLRGWKGLHDGPALAMQLEGEPWKMNLSGRYPTTPDWKITTMDVELTGPTRHVGTARRVGVAVPDAASAIRPDTATTRPVGIAHVR